MVGGDEVEGRKWRDGIGGKEVEGEGGRLREGREMKGRRTYRCRCVFAAFVLKFESFLFDRNIFLHICRCLKQLTRQAVHQRGQRKLARSFCKSTSPPT